jgi:hypothetical protein
MLKRKTPLTRTAIANKSPHKRTPEQGGDEEHLRWVRRQPCSMCGKGAPSHAHHPTGAGMALKGPDKLAVPLCHTCHRQYHDGRGRFADWGRIQKREWMAKMAAELQIIRFAEQLKNAP